MSVFYLKYRPQKISQLDLEEIRESLTKLLSSGRIPHALLFSGPKGAGKTSSARIIAKAINCLRRQQVTRNKQHAIEPCNKCRICKSITAATALDLIEIDAASNRGIDDIRNLREKIKLTPAEAKYKVYVIDECHMLTTPAFNALLKTLEEPPEHAIFILCTTQPQDLPETVLSRCLRFDFKKASTSEISRSLRRIVKGEDLKVEKGVLEKIAAIADGSFRDATKILEQLSFGRKKISLRDVKEERGLPQELLENLAKAKTQKTLSWIEKQSSKGADWPFVIKKILELLHQLLLSHYGLAEKPLELNLSITQIQNLIRLFEKTGLEIKLAEIPQLPLEVMVVDWCGKKDLPRTTESHGRKSVVRGLPAKEIKKKGADVEKVEEVWESILQEVKPFNHSVEALLRSSRPKAIKGDGLTVEVFYKFHKEKLEDVSYKELVEKAVRKILGRPLKICYTLANKGVKKT